MARATRTSSTDEAQGFTAEERAAMKERAREARTARTRAAGADGTADVLAKIAEMPDEDRELAERIHRIVTTAAPDLAPRTWYGQPAYARDGKVVVFFQPASKFGVRYSTLGFNDVARLDDGAMWPTAYALTSLDAAGEERVAELVRRAVG